MRCIVINLARAAARRQAITEQLRALDMEFEILNAKDWQELTEHDYASVDAVARERQGRRALSSGMIACAISHRWAFEELLSGEADMAVIVEDDVTLSPDFKQFLGVVENTGVDFDVIFLHRNKPENTFLPVERIGKRRLGLVKLGIRIGGQWDTSSPGTPSNAILSASRKSYIRSIIRCMRTGSMASRFFPSIRPWCIMETSPVLTRIVKKYGPCGATGRSPNWRSASERSCVKVSENGAFSRNEFEPRRQAPPRRRMSISSRAGSGTPTPVTRYGSVQAVLAHYKDDMTLDEAARRVLDPVEVRTIPRRTG